ncbi:FKBP-type peptidyl-prolyl cis-trans isomerase [Hymenobacter arizonensis]|uniref:FKBP-type peptidyl-prolyl cis-trans isomerase n=1 Tax=Hymenobacter arizonensis TaxID=1227077 RepID=UPI0015A69E31|nr:FKBP-type peptidyl-prolyl cis-trans isomerase [Hymenobacter arizonensis]
MNRLLLLTFLVASGLFTTACQKDAPEPKDYSGIDDEIITKYLAEKNITTAQKQPSGFYFIPVTSNPNGVKVTPGSTVSVLYTGRLLDASGTVFATSSQNNTPSSFIVGARQVIPGFEAGVALMKIGDKAEFIIPSALAYGPASQGGVPANSVVRFEVEVVDQKLYDDSLIVQHLVNKNITNAQRQPSGLHFVPVTTNPNAVPATAGKTVSVLYTGQLLDGTVFDATSRRGNVPLEFIVGRAQVIAGFDEGIALMKKGEKATLFIPSALAYGTQGAGATIQPNTVLRFDVELVDVK